MHGYFHIILYYQSTTIYFAQSNHTFYYTGIQNALLFMVRVENYLLSLWYMDPIPTRLLQGYKTLSQLCETLYLVK